MGKVYRLWLEYGIIGCVLCVSSASTNETPAPTTWEDDGWKPDGWKPDGHETPAPTTWEDDGWKADGHETPVPTT